MEPLHFRSGKMQGTEDLAGVAAASMEPLPFRSGKSLIYIHVEQFHI